MLVRRYLSREILLSVTFSLLVFLALFAFFDVAAEMENINTQRYGLQQVLFYVALTLPQRAYELLPIVTLIGTVTALAVMAARSEFTIFRMSGLSTRMLLVLLLQIGLPFALLTFVFGEWIAPLSSRYAERYRLEARGDMINHDFRTGLWIRDSVQTPAGQQITFINFRQVNPDNSLAGVQIYAFDEHFQLDSITRAPRGDYLPPNQWLLKDVTITRFDGQDPAQPPTAAQVTQLREQLWQSRLHPDILNVLLVVPEKMSALALTRYISHLASNGQKTNRYEIALWNKVSYPLALFVMITLALPFAYLHIRSGGVSLKIFSGVMIGVLFHLMNTLFARVGVLNTWPPFLTAILPSLLMLLLTLAALRWVERR